MGHRTNLMFKQHLQTFNMKTATAIFCLFLAVANAVPKQYFYSNPISKPGVYGVPPSGDPCFEGRLQACKTQFEVGKIASHNCKGWCGLCDLCNTPQAANVPECGTICTLGVAKCTEVCENGKKQFWLVASFRFSDFEI